MGFVKIFWKNNFQDAYTPKISNSGQIVSETPIFYFISTFHVINFSYGKCDKNLSVASISEEWP